ncbi:MAG TPA: PAS domain S-box protein [Desulfomonilia bacterium]
MHRLFSGLRFQLVLLILIIVLPLSGLFIYSAFEQRRIDMGQINTDVIKLTKVSANQQQRFFENSREILLLLSLLPAIRDNNPSKCNETFSRLLSLYPFYSNIAAYSPSGDCFSSAIPLNKAINSSGEAWFKRAVLSRNFSIGNYHTKGSITGRKGISAALPVYDEAGALKAVLRVSIDLSMLGNLITENLLPDGAVIIVSDRNGTILARNPDHEKYVGKTFNNIPMIRGMLKNDSNDLIPVKGMDGVERLCSFAEVRIAPEAVLFLVTGISKSVAVSRINRSLAYNLTGLLLFTLLAISLAWYGADKLLISKINNLQRATERLSTGSLEERSGFRDYNGEIGSLAYSFDNMADSLEQRQKEIDDAHESMMVLNERLIATLDAIPDYLFEVDEFGIIYDFRAPQPEKMQVMPELFVGRNVRDILSETSTAIVEKAISEARETGVHYGSSYSFETSSGTRWFELSIASKGDTASSERRFIAIAHDITTQKRMEEELRRNETKYREIFNNAFYGIFRSSFGKKFVDMNKALSDMFGYDSPKEMIDSVSDIEELYVNPVEREKMKAELIKSGFVKNLVIELKHRDGHHIWGRFNVQAILDENRNVILYEGSVEDITKMKQAEDALKQSEERYRMIIENSYDIIFNLNDRGDFTYLSPSFEKNTGYKISETLGTQFLDILHPDDIQKCMEAFTETCSGKLVSGTEYRFRHSDGSWHWYNINGSIYHDSKGSFVSLTGIAWDVTKRKLAEEELHKKSAELQLIFNNMINAFVVWESSFDQDGNYVSFRFGQFNDAFTKITGLKNENIRGKDVFDVWPETEQSWVDAYGSVALTGVPRIFDMYHGPTKKWYHCNAYRPSDSQNHICVIFEDITELKEVEEQRINLERQLQQTQKLEGLGVLAGGIAHDFNNILMVITGNADLALMDIPEQSPAASKIENIKKASFRAADLCKQMLAYSGKGRFMVVPINLSDLINDMKNMLEISVSKKVSLRYYLGRDLPSINADVAQIQQIILNLVINASEALDDKKGNIVISTTGLEYNSKDDSATLSYGEIKEGGSCVCLDITDDGCGMDKETVDKIFDPFYTTKFTGRGLGLAAVQGIVRGHKGAIKIFSEIDKGTTFRIFFPAIEKAAVDFRTPSGKQKDWTGSGVVLIADDEEYVCNICKQLLENWGFEVLIASDGKEALNVFRENSDIISLVLLDVTMPEMNGDEVFREIRLINPEMPVIMSSGYGEQEVVSRFEENNLSGFVQKPYHSDTLKSVIRKALAKQ